MGSSTTLLTLSLLLLLLASAVSSSSILDAADILSAAGFECMALHLELASQALPQHHSLTIFAPSDFAFEHLPHHIHFSLLRYHLLPHSFSLHSLTSLPFGARIPTLLPSHSLTVTTNKTKTISINNISLNPTPIFQHPNLSIFSTPNFFNPHFQHQHQHQIHPHPPPKPATCPSPPPHHNPLSNASRLLNSRGFSLMSALLDLQFPPSCTRQLTLFAPLTRHNLTVVADLPPFLRRHLVPCKLTWRDLESLEDGTLIRTYEKGFTINVTKSNPHLLLNGVHVAFPDMYLSDWLVVHGVRHVLSNQHHHGKRRHHHRSTRDSNRVSAEEEEEEEQDHAGDAEEESSDEGEGHSAHHYHFSAFH